MPSYPEPTFVRILETNSLTDIATIKSVLDAEGVRYFLNGENMQFLRPVDSVQLMVASENVEQAIELLKLLKLTYMQFNRDNP
jgi:hypothetical protein